VQKTSRKGVWHPKGRLEARFSDGDVIEVDAKGGELTFSKVRARAAETVA